MARDRGFSELLLYCLMVSPGVMLLKDGAFLGGYRYRGPDMESATDREIEYLSARINAAFKKMGQGWMVHVDMIRRPAAGYPENRFTEPTNRLIDLEREEQFKAEGAHFETVNTMIFTWLPPRSEQNKQTRRIVNALTGAFNRETAEELLDRQVAYFENVLKDVGETLGISLKLERLRSGPDNDELIQILDYIVNGRWHRARPCTLSYLDTLLARDCVNGVDFVYDNSYLAFVSVFGYPLESCPGILNALQQLPIEVRWSNRFIFTDYRTSVSFLKWLRRRWDQKKRSFVAQVTQNENAPVDQDAVLMTADVDDALTEISSGDVGYGHHTSTVVIRADDRDLLESHAREVVKVFEEAGFNAQIERSNAMEAFLGSLPGHGYQNVRKPFLSTINFADIAPNTNDWTGLAFNPSPEIRKYYRQRGLNEDPPALLQGASIGSTPFKLNIHYGDIGHTLILGPTGSGKSTILAAICSQFERYEGAQIFFFDKGKSIYPLAMACMDSVHYNIGGDIKGSLCPLADIDDPLEMAWAAQWIETLVVLNGGELTPRRRTRIYESLKTLAASTVTSDERTLTHFVSSLQDSDLREVMGYYTIDGQAGHLLDGKLNDITYRKFTVFEIEDLMGMGDKICSPVLMYLFRQIEKRLRGQPSLLVIDEAWLALSNPVFADRIKEWLKVFRKANCAVVLATQELSDIVSSKIRDSVLDACPTRILLPNPGAETESMMPLYASYLSLNEQQIRLVASSVKKRDYYYTAKMMGDRLFSLGLGPVALSFAGASGKEDLKAIEALHGEHGKKWPYYWLKKRGLEDWAEVWMKLHRSWEEEEAKKRLNEEREREERERAAREDLLKKRFMGVEEAV